MLNSNLTRKIKLYGTETIAKIKKELLNSRSSGRLLNSLNYEVKSIVEGISMDINAEDYFQYVDEGRSPGKMPNVNSIKSWCRIKGIPQSAAFPIAKNIGKFGIKPANLLADIGENKINTTEWEVSYYKDIIKYLEKNIKNLK